MCEDSLGALLGLGLRFFIYAVLFGLIAMGMLQGIVAFGPGFYSDGGPVEILQSVFALMTAGFFLLASRHDAGRTPFAVLISGFLFCVVVRESDYILDELFRHLWKVGVTVILILTAVYGLRVRKQIPASVSRFVCHPAFGLFMAGILVLLVFSRLFGKGDYWEGIILDWKWEDVKALVREHTQDTTYTLLMENKYMTIKRVVEETSEQIGYFLMLIASYEYFLDARKAGRRKTRHCGCQRYDRAARRRAGRANRPG